MEIVNLTDKPVSIVNDNGHLLKSYPSMGRATVNVNMVKEREVDGVPIYSKRYGRVLGLPQPVNDLSVMYIVSHNVADAAKDSRFDLLVPDDQVTKQGKNYYKTLVTL